jgi:hypothetical protein
MSQKIHYGESLTHEHAGETSHVVDDYMQQSNSMSITMHHDHLDINQFIIEFITLIEVHYING